MRSESATATRIILKAGASRDLSALARRVGSRALVLNQVAQEVGATANQVIYAWMLQGSPTVLPLVAVSNKEQMAENLGALDVQLSSEQMDRLTNAGG